MVTPQPRRARSPSVTRFSSGSWSIRALDIRRIPAMFAEAAVATAVIMLIICAAQAFGFFLSWERMPNRLSEAMLGGGGGALTSNPLLILLLINLMLIGVGMILEGGAALIILAPLFSSR